MLEVIVPFQDVMKLTCLIMVADARCGSRWDRGCVRSAYIGRCCSSVLSPRYSSSYKVRFIKDENLLAGLAFLQEQLSSVGSEITLKYMLREIGRVLSTDHVCIVSRSPCKLRWMMAVVFEVFGGAFDLAISERNI